MLLLILLSITELVHCTTFTEPVNTTNGLVRGIISEDGDYYMYFGVPYAKVNKSNPFGASEPYPHFDGVFDANDENKVCPQQEQYDFKIVGTLDCLNLNIYVPRKSSFKEKLPVLAYIFGGRFTYGYPNRLVYGPKFLVDHDVIVVSINYRLGPYGFMCLDTEDVPGNQGLKDQHSALKWIFENIDSFGGDVDKITLMGNSAGAMSIDLHLLSKLPKFFNQAILQSGAGLIPGVIVLSHNTAPLKIVKHLGFNTNDLQKALLFLADTHSDLVIAATVELGMQFRPCVEKDFNKVDRFIDMHPEHKNVSNINRIKILGGFNSEEELRYNVTEDMIQKNIKNEFNITDMEKMINKVRRFYIGDGTLNQPEVIRELTKFASDFIFNNPMQRSLIRYAESGHQVYQYMFSYNGFRNFGKIRAKKPVDGVVHADELGYLFDVSFMTEKPRAEDQMVIDRMTTMWTNFVKFGNPTPRISALIPVRWLPVTRDVIWYLDINSDLVLGKCPYHARLTFWDLFYEANQDKLLANIIYDPNYW